MSKQPTGNSLLLSGWEKTITKKHKSVLGNFHFYGKRLFSFDKTINIIE